MCRLVAVCCHGRVFGIPEIPACAAGEVRVSGGRVVTHTWFTATLITQTSLEYYRPLPQKRSDSRAVTDTDSLSVRSLFHATLADRLRVSCRRWTELD